MKNKHILSKLKNNYYKCPLKIFRLGLSIEAIGLYNYLASCSEEFNPSVRYTSKILRINPKRLKRYYTELEKKNVIKCIHKGYKNITKKYEMVSPNFWIL